MMDGYILVLLIIKKKKMLFSELAWMEPGNSSR